MTSRQRDCEAWTGATVLTLCVLNLWSSQREGQGRSTLRQGAEHSERFLSAAIHEPVGCVAWRAFVRLGDLDLRVGGSRQEGRDSHGQRHGHFHAHADCRCQSEELVAKARRQAGLLHGLLRRALACVAKLFGRLFGRSHMHRRQRVTWR